MSWPQLPQVLLDTQRALLPNPASFWLHCSERLAGWERLMRGISRECRGRLCPPQLSSHTPFWSLGIALAWIEIDKPERVLVWGLAISVTPKYSTNVLCSTKPKNIGQALSPLIFKLMCFSRKCNPYVWGTFLCNSSNHARLYESFDVWNAWGKSQIDEKHCVSTSRASDGALVGTAGKAVN